MITWRGVAEVAELRLPEDQALRRGRRVAVLEAEAGVSPTAGCCGSRTGRARPRGSGSARTRARSSRRGGRGGGCEKVPRSVSWPVSRMWVPSVSSDAKASASAWPNSIGPSSRISSRRSSGLRSLRWTVKLSGNRTSSSFSVRSRFSETFVSTSGLLVRSSSPVPPVDVGSSYSPASIFARSSLSVAESSLAPLGGLLLDLLGRDHALLLELRARRSRDRRVRLDLRRLLGLGVRGLVGLVVAVAAVADQVDDDVAARTARGRPSPAGSRRCSPRRRRR